MPKLFSRRAGSIFLIAAAAIALPGVIPVAAQAADMVRWQEPPRAKIVRPQRPRHLVRTSYSAPRIYECDFLRIDYIEGRREIVRNCHPPVF